MRDYHRINDLIVFRKFMQVAASRTGQMLNYNELANDIGVAMKIVKTWFNVLEATGLVTVIQLYFNNLTKRAVKTSKFYFLDNGLCCYLTDWMTPEVLEKGAMAGSMLETYVVSEILKSHIHNGKKPHFYYYADKEKKEIDLLIEEAGKLNLIAVKKVFLRNMNFKEFGFLENNKTQIGHGAVICLTEKLLPMGGEVPGEYI